MFTSVIYKNNQPFYNTVEMRPVDAYRFAVPEEAKSGTDSRWHLMMLPYAIEKMNELFVGESLRIAWKEPSNVEDNIHILIIRSH